jgi:hypothetical protein
MIHSHMERMNPKDFPPALSKMFWEGMATRRRYEEQVGDMWTTTDVMTIAGETFQSLRMSLLLIPDALFNETELSEVQMKIVQDVIDNNLEMARERLVNDLRKPSRLGPGATPEEGEL